jgi:hypothetical protein
VVARLLIEHVQRVHLVNTRQQVDIPSPLAHRADLAVPLISTDLAHVEEIGIMAARGVAVVVQVAKSGLDRAAAVGLTTLVAAPVGKLRCFNVCILSLMCSQHRQQRGYL